MTRKEYVQRFNDFCDAALKLAEDIEETNTEVIVSEKYPFNKSFDEFVTEDIFNWRESVFKAIAKANRRN